MLLPKDIRRAFRGARIGAMLALGPGKLDSLGRVALIALVAGAALLLLLFFWRA